MIHDKYIHFNLNEVLLDSTAVGSAIAAACVRQSPMRLHTILQLDEIFVAVLQPVASRDDATADVRFSEVHFPGMDTLLAALNERWQGGYEPVGLLADKLNDGTTRRILVTSRSYKD